MAKYEQYAEYKDSGVEWLGEVPHEWNVVKLSYKMKLASGDTLTANDIEPIGQYAVYGGNGLRGYTKDYNCDGSYILIGRQGALCGNINLAKGKFFATEHAVVVYPYEEFNITFLSGFLEFMDLGQYSVSAAQPGLSVDRINALHILVPPINEQIIIGEFLDHETAQIDTLIEKQQTLIQLLKEKRQAVISHAVTKGLNPDAPMKDSGVEWLGEVPEHWEVKKLKYVCDLISQKTEINYQEVIALENIESWTGNFVSSDSGYSGQDVGFDAGDILFSKLRPYLAKVYLAKAEGVAFGDLLVYRPKTELLNKYGFYLMTNEGFISAVNSSTYGSKMPRASTEFISEMPVVIPLIQEQKQIVDYVDKILARFDNLVSKAQKAIQLMQERRTALISAAVTGKIDVRGWVAPEGDALSLSAS